MNRHLLLATVFLVGAAFGLGSCMGLAQTGAMANAYEAFGQGDCDAVLENLANAEHYRAASPELLAEIRFLRAQCLEIQGRRAEALGTYKFIADIHPDTEYGYRAKEKIKQLDIP